MNTSLKVALIQTNLHWEDTRANRQMFDEKINSIQEKVDLIVLPEMFSTGFTMNAIEMAETMDGVTVFWLKEKAMSFNCAITGSLIIQDNDNNYYNRLLFINSDGSVEKYDKHQLFTLAKEHEVYTAGQEEIIIDFKGWKIKPQICYDLRFPVWARNTTDYDVLLYVASWPKMRINAWDTLLKARAIENMAYCIGVNRVGTDSKGFEYNGHTSVYDTLGKCLFDESAIEDERIRIVTLDKTHIEETRNKLGFLNDRDNFKLIF